MEKKKNMFQVAGNFLSQLKYVLVFDDDGKVFLEYWFIFNYLYIESEDGKEEENDPSGWNLST